MEKIDKALKTPKEKTRKSKMPEGYIGRPKPMKVKKQFFHKPTIANWIEIGLLLGVTIFVTVIILKLINVGKLTSPEFDYYEMNDKVLQKEFILESNELKFELDPVTTQFTVLNKKSGKVWYSNPQDVDLDTLALPKEKNNIRSPFLLKYSTVNGTDDIYDTYTKSTTRNTYQIEQKGNEIHVHYTIGEIQREYLFPLAIYEDEIQKWQEGLSKSQVNSMLRAYQKFTYDGIRDEAEREAMVSKYPELKNQTLYLVFENLQTFLKEQTEKTFNKQGYTYEDYLRHKQLYKETSSKEEPAFNLTAIYKIENNKLVVEVPFDNVSYRNSYPITQVSILPYFGAGNLEAKGFMLVPEGGGNIINFNNGKTRQNTYYADVYGWDYATGRKYVNTETRIAYPVFGISNETDSFICVLENGASYASISADIAGKLCNYNYVRADYRMLHREQFDVSNRNTSAQYSYEPYLPQGESLKQTYIFTESPSYVDMAKTYQTYLFKGQAKTNNKDVPLAIDLVGAIDKVQQVLGYPKALPYELTDYNSITRIVKEIEAQGIKNANVRLTGFINEGVHQTYLNKIKFISQLGGASDFNKMLKDLNGSSSKLYLDAYVQTAFRSGFTDGFNRFKTPARFASDEVCEISQYSPIWYGELDEQDTYYLLKPSVINKNTDRLIKAVQKYNIGISFSDNGYTLSADYDNDGIVSRENCLNQQVLKFQEIKDKNIGLMTRSGNNYTLKYADFITDVNLKGNNYSILDKAVPFYQIALHGYKNFASEPLNIGFEFEDLVLQSAQTACGLFFTFMDAKETKLEETKFSQYFSCNFDAQKERFYKVYNDYNSKLSKVINSCIVDFEYLTDTVTRTEFENGYEVYVNFGYEDYTNSSGTKVSLRDYVLVKKGE